MTPILRAAPTRPPTCAATSTDPSDRPRAPPRTDPRGCSSDVEQRRPPPAGSHGPAGPPDPSGTPPRPGPAPGLRALPGGDRRHEGEDPVSNNVKLSCDSETPDGDRPGRTTVTAWVNDRLVAQAVDEKAAPSDHDGHGLVRKQRIAYDRGQGEAPLRVLFEDYRLHKAGD